MKRINFLMLALLIALPSGVGGYYWQKAKRQKQASAYKEASVKRGSLHATVLSTGSVQPENRLEIKSPFNGRVEKILVEEGQPIKKGQILAWVSSTERAALVDSARADGKSEIEYWEKFYKPTAIYAPINGILILQNVEPGQSFTTQDAILVLSDRLTVKAQVDETDISKIYLRQKAQIVLDAYPNQPLEAYVDHRGFDAKTINSITTYIVDVVPNKTPDFMLSGMTANVRFFLSEKPNVLLIPAEAIKTKDGRPYVLTPSQNDAPQEKFIQVGLTEGDEIEILSGLSEGEVILIQNVEIPQKKQNVGNPFSPFRGGGSGRPGK